ncbi:MAG TPA: ATP synthase F0 subunit B [Polyangiaceae bacterium]|jgi:F-type H+-transporting ATPase subunit b|nr:ATP synthase F0 subunit B [Polyangiaceae bacterium]
MTALASLGLALSQSAQEGSSLFGAAGAVNIDFDWTFVGQMVVFAVLILVMKPLVYDPVLSLFEEREKRTDGAKADAREMQEKAGVLLRKYEHELEKVHQVAAAERDKVRAETARLEADQMNEARVIASKIIDDGRERIAEEIHSVRFELGRSSERLARDIASRILGREVA